MKVGCGFVEKTIHGSRYLYVWSFEPRGHGSQKVERYVGPATSAEARRKVIKALDAYASRAIAQLERRRARWRRQLGVP